MGLPINRLRWESPSVPPASFFHVSTGWPQCCYASTVPPVYIIHAALPFPRRRGFHKKPKWAYSCSTSGDETKEQVKKQTRNRYSMSFPFVFLFKACVLFVSKWAFVLGLYLVLGFEAFTVVKMLYENESAAEYMLNEKINEFKKRSFYSNQLWLCSPGTALPHSFVKRVTTGQRSLPS